MFGTFCSVFTSRGDYIFYMIVSNEYFEIIELLYGKLWTLFDSFSSLALVNVQRTSLQISGPP